MSTVAALFTVDERWKNSEEAGHAVAVHSGGAKEDMMQRSGGKIMRSYVLYFFIYWLI